MAVHNSTIIDKQFLDSNPNAIFVFGDNLQHVGKGGAAALRDHPQAIGFITKKAPNNDAASFFRPEEYSKLFFDQLRQLETLVKDTPEKTFYISRLGGGLANRHRIWELLIRHNLEMSLEEFDNVVFCWED